MDIYESDYELFDVYECGCADFVNRAYGYSIWKTDTCETHYGAQERAKWGPFFDPGEVGMNQEERELRDSIVPF